MSKLNPNILRWARETAGFSSEDAAKKLGVGVERLKELERGERDPSSRQLLLMAEKYRRPLVTFYLPEPPPERQGATDFRSVSERQSPQSEALLQTIVRDVQARQQLVRSALEEADEAVVLGFVGSLKREQGVESFVASMRELIPVSLEQFRAQQNVTEAFALLRANVEKLGVYVLLMGNLGTHHTNLDANVFRGFTLSDNFAPFVVINENDSRSAWSFTLLHELAHVWSGETAISGYESNNRLERFCDEVASRFLLPLEELGEFDGAPANVDELKIHIGEFSRARNLSRKMVAYNLYLTGMLSSQLYRTLSDGFDAERKAAKERAGEDRAEGGPNYYTVRRHRVGAGLVSFIARMVSGGTLSTLKAGRVLGVKPTAVGRMVDTNRAA